MSEDVEEMWDAEDPITRLRFLPQNTTADSEKVLLTINPLIISGGKVDQFYGCELRN